MIPASTIYQELQSLLDATGSSYYDVNLDYIPAINRAQRNLVAVINSTLGAKDFAEQYYRELVKNMIFQTSQYSRVDLTPASNTVVWDILDVVVNPTLNIPFSPIVVPNGLSAPRPTLFYVSGGSSCERLNAKEWVDNAKNPFKGGYNGEPTGKNLKYAYLQFIDYFNGIYPNVIGEIEMRPYVPVQPVAVTFVKMPTDIAALTDNLDFPMTFLDILTKAALKEISTKQGDGITNYQSAMQDLMSYIKATS